MYRISINWLSTLLVRFLVYSGLLVVKFWQGPKLHSGFWQCRRSAPLIPCFVQESNVFLFYKRSLNNMYYIDILNNMYNIDIFKISISYKEIWFMISHINNYDYFSHKEVWAVYQIFHESFWKVYMTKFFWLQKLIDNHEYIMVKHKHLGTNMPIGTSKECLAFNQGPLHV